MKRNKLGVTLLTGSAKVWFNNLRLLNSTPTTSWLGFKQELRAFFKPDNAIPIARDRVCNLKQTASIAQYVQEFITIKLSIPRRTDEEAVDKFISGLRGPAARINIKDNIQMESPVLSEAIWAAHVFKGNRMNVVSLPNKGLSMSAMDNSGLMLDDPMDLSVVEQKELLNYMT